jgi:hypothetical protein
MRNYIIMFSICLAIAYPLFGIIFACFHFFSPGNLSLLKLIRILSNICHLLFAIWGLTILFMIIFNGIRDHELLFIFKTAWPLFAGILICFILLTQNKIRKSAYSMVLISAIMCIAILIWNLLIPS